MLFFPLFWREFFFSLFLCLDQSTFARTNYVEQQFKSQNQAIKMVHLFRTNYNPLVTFEFLTSKECYNHRRSSPLQVIIHLQLKGLSGLSFILLHCLGVRSILLKGKQTTRNCPKPPPNGLIFQIKPVVQIHHLINLKTI